MLRPPMNFVRVKAPATSLPIDKECLSFERKPEVWASCTAIIEVSKHSKDYVRLSTSSLKMNGETIVNP